MGWNDGELIASGKKHAKVSEIENIRQQDDFKKRVDDDIDRYLKAGGVIDVIPMGVLAGGEQIKFGRTYPCRVRS